MNRRAVLSGVVAFLALSFLFAFTGIPIISTLIAGIGSGLVAVYVSKDKNYKKAAKTGGMAGALGGIIIAVLSIIVIAYQISTGAAGDILSPETIEAVNSAGGGIIIGLGMIFAMVMLAVIGFVLGAAGGMIGTVTFKGQKRKVKRKKVRRKARRKPKRRKRRKR